MIFDGKTFAKEIENKVGIKVASFEKKLKIVSILVGNDPASEVYTRLKKQAAERTGILFEVIRLNEGVQEKEISLLVEEYGKDENVTGVMLQLPIPGISGESLRNVLSRIPLTKDVDGLRWEESKIQPATVRAVMNILEEITIVHDASVWTRKFVVLGSRGVVGKPLVHFLREKNVKVVEVEWDTPDPSKLIFEAEVVISCVGKAGVVTGEMIDDGTIVIDVGMSQVEGRVVGDMSGEVYQKASIAVPVPGGVGPVTIASLLLNTVEMRDQL